MGCLNKIWHCCSCTLCLLCPNPRCPWRRLLINDTLPRELLLCLPRSWGQQLHTSPVYWSLRVGKGMGGTTEQLRKVGEAVAPGHRKKPDPFAAAGEACNLMVPESQQRTKKVSDTSHPQLDTYCDDNDSPETTNLHPNMWFPRWIRQARGLGSSW